MGEDLGPLPRSLPLVQALGPRSGGAAVTGVSMRMAGGIASLDALRRAAEDSWELHCQAPFGRYDAEAVLSFTPGKVRARV